MEASQLIEISTRMISADPLDRQEAERMITQMGESKPGLVLFTILELLTDTKMSADDMIMTFLLIYARNTVKRGTILQISGEEWERLIYLVFFLSFFFLL